MSAGLKPQGTGSEYVELPEGVWRFVVGEPKIRRVWMQRWNHESVMVDFPLELTEDEKTRLKEEYGETAGDKLQSWRPSFGGYSCGLTWGRKDKPSAFSEFMAAVFGKQNQQKVRAWVAAGGCFVPQAEDNEAADAEVTEWLRWLEGLEIYGTIRHEAGERGTLARFGGPMAVGSLPKQPEESYQRDAGSKLRAFITEAAEHGDGQLTVAAVTPATVEVAPAPKTAPPARTYEELFGTDGDE